MKRVVSAMAACAALSAFGHGPERIEVEGHYENGVGTSDAASAGIVTAKVIENRPLLRPAEVLEFVPGVVITQHSGGGKANQYFLRGFNLDHGTDFATFVAGMPVNMPTHAHGQGYSDLNFLVPELVSRMAYAKGPYAATSGDFASAGTARIDLVDKVSRPTASLTLGEGRYERALAMGSGSFADGVLLAAGEGAGFDGPWTTRQDLKRFNGILRYSHVGDTTWHLTAMAYQSSWNSTDQIPRRAVDEGRLGRFDAVDPTDAGRSGRYSLSWDAQSLVGFGILDAGAFVIRSRLDLFSNFTYFMDDPIHGDQFEQSERRTVAGAQAAYRWSSNLAGKDLTHEAGAQLREDRVEPVGLYHTSARARFATTREDRVRESSLGLYYQGTARFSESLRVIGGLRYDAYRFRVASDREENSGSASDTIVSPKAGMAWEAAPHVEIFANWGRGFHSNDARGTTTSVDPATGLPLDRVTPLVRTTGYEGGLRLELADGLQVSVALWALDTASELMFVGDAGTTEASRPSKRRGIEWNNHWAASRHLLLDLDVSLSKARFTDSDPAGDRIPGAVERVVSGGVALTNYGPWSASLQLRHFGPRPLVEDGSVRSNSTTLFNGRIGHRFSPAWSVALDAFNLLNRKASDVDYFYTSRLRGERSAGVDDVHFHPVEPRSFRFAVTLRF